MSGETLPSVREGLLDELVCSTIATSSGLRDIFTGLAGVARSNEDSSDDDSDGDDGGSGGFSCTLTVRGTSSGHGRDFTVR